MNDPLDLIDHPPGDAEPPRNGALTAQVMERVRQAARPPVAAAARWPWVVAVLVAAALAWLPLDGELDAELALDPLLLAECAAMALVALVILAWSRRTA